MSLEAGGYLHRLALKIRGQQLFSQARTQNRGRRISSQARAQHQRSGAVFVRSRSKQRLGTFFVVCTHIEVGGYFHNLRSNQEVGVYLHSPHSKIYARVQQLLNTSHAQNQDQLPPSPTHTTSQTNKLTQCKFRHQAIGLETQS